MAETNLIHLEAFRSHGYISCLTVPLHSTATIAPFFFGFPKHKAIGTLININQSYTARKTFDDFAVGAIAREVDSLAMPHKFILKDWIKEGGLPTLVSCSIEFGSHPTEEGIAKYRHTVLCDLL